MIYPISRNIDKNDCISIGGVSVVDLAREFGTPLYILDEATIVDNCRKYVETLKANYPDSMVCYASKALSNVGLLNILAEQDMGLDVVSGGELYTALKSKMDTNKILFHGNNKSVEELEFACQNNIKIVLDNEQELTNLIAIAKKLNRKIEVLIRLKPEVDAHTHDFIKTGKLDSKFGIEKHNLLNVVKRIVESGNLIFLGLHAHIGSQIFDVKPFEELVRILVNYAVKIRKELNVATPILNVGGGVGICYIKTDDPLDIVRFVESIVNTMKIECAKHDLPLPKLIMEPGRSIVGKAGVTLYTVGAVKEIPQIKNYIFVDGGMADNPRPIMYQASYTFELANKAAVKKEYKYSIAGKFCESGDVLGKDIHLPKAETGDLLAVYATGAYNYAMSSNYNRFCKPAMVLVKQGQAKLIVKREDYADIIRNDIL